MSAENSKHAALYFLDPHLAYKTAMQGNRVKVRGERTGCQVCYYGGEKPFADGPYNLVYAPFDNLGEFLINTRFRLPNRLVMRAGMSQDRVKKLQKDFARLLQYVRTERIRRALRYLELCNQRTPDFSEAPPYRIFITSSIYSTVVQYASKGLKRAFEKLGHEVLFVEEQNDAEQLHEMVMVPEYARFEPHFSVQINIVESFYANFDAPHVSWWQDPAWQLKREDPLPWREKDLIYNLTDAALLRKTGAHPKNIKQQFQCIDTSIFNVKNNVQRRNKAVFVGGAKHIYLKGTPGENALFQELTECVEKGRNPTFEEVQMMARNHDVAPEHATGSVWHIVVRTAAVRWLCRQSDLVDVEVYGRHWEEDPVVRPFFYGELEHGAPVADVYNSARFAFCAHERAIVQQRLPEAGACGAMPVIYDCGGSSPYAFINEEALFFRTEEELRECLKSDAKTTPQIWAETFSYDGFARRIIKDVESVKANDVDAPLRKVLAAAVNNGTSEEQSGNLAFTDREREQLTDYLFNQADNVLSRHAEAGKSGEEEPPYPNRVLDNARMLLLERLYWFTDYWYELSFEELNELQQTMSQS